MNKVIIIFVMSVFAIRIAAVPLSDELLTLHHATSLEMNSVASPDQGSLIFNTDDHEIYEYNATAWNRISSDGSETKIIAGDCVKVTGIGTLSSPYLIENALAGKTETTAGATCKQILDTGCAVGDGVYWINPDGGDTSNAFKVYCDMTTDGGGWTRVGYKSDFVDQKYFGSSDSWRWLDNNFSLLLTDAQIDDIRAVSTEGKQKYIGLCDGVLHYYYDDNDNYDWAFGFRLHTGFETVYGQQNYTGVTINILQDGCSANKTNALSTVFEILDLRLPVINVYSNDTGGSTETFGSPLLNNPAWFR